MQAKRSLCCGSNFFHCRQSGLFGFEDAFIDLIHLRVGWANGFEVLANRLTLAEGNGLIFKDGLGNLFVLGKVLAVFSLGLLRAFRRVRGFAFVSLLARDLLLLLVAYHWRLVG